MTNHRSDSWDIVVVGGINVDYAIRGSKLPGPGETETGEQFFMGPGGKGANQAVAAARLGAKVVFIGRVGTDQQGDFMLDVLRSEGVETRFIIRDRSAHTGAAVIMIDSSGEKQILAAHGANRSLTVKDVMMAFERIHRTRILLIQLEVPYRTVVASARIAKSSGARIVFDPAPPVLIPGNDLLHQIDVIRPNSSEAEALTGIRVTGRSSARRAARALLSKGVRAVVLQAGNEGNLLVTGETEVMVPKWRVKSIDATGAGDAFAGGLAAALARNVSIENAVEEAGAAAALSTTKLGAQAGLPNRKELTKFLQRFRASKQK